MMFYPLNMTITYVILDCFSNKIMVSFHTSLYFRGSMISISGVLSYTLHEESFAFSCSGWNMVIFCMHGWGADPPISHLGRSVNTPWGRPIHIHFIILVALGHAQSHLLALSRVAFHWLIGCVRSKGDLSIFFGSYTPDTSILCYLMYCTQHGCPKCPPVGKYSSQYFAANR